MEKGHKLLILDLNKVLVFRAYEPELERDNPEAFAVRDFGELVYKTRVWKRPGLESFLDFCFEHFTVAVWSSVRYHNLEAALKCVFSFQQRKLLRFIWCQNECTQIDIGGGAVKPLFKKPLQKVWAIFGDYNATNTIILDDSEEKLQDNPKECCICIDSWVPYAGDGLQDETFLEGGILRKKLISQLITSE